MSASTTDTKAFSKYQKLTDKEHILKKPDTYIGSIQNSEHFDYIYENDKIIQKNYEFIPGLYKLFDESIVNCRDHVIRQNQSLMDKVPNTMVVNNIDVSISDDGIISFTNDGNGIDIAEHPEYKMWIPEMIFGHLRTSTNYDEDKKEKIVGGKNGFGVKLVFIWSTWGKVETIDHVRGLKYVQEFKNNLNEICKPSVTKCKNKPYTRISFRPDYERFKIDGLSQDMKNLFMKRIYDIGAVTDKSVKVKYNGEAIPIKSFEQYIDCYIGPKTESKRVYEYINNRWEYAVAIAPNDEFQQVSFVNGIYTAKGGKHVDYILNQIVRKLVAYIQKKKKVDVKPNTIKEQLVLFLRCDVEDPSFSSQTKDELTTPAAKFGSSCNVSDVFIDKVAKMGVMNAACALTEVKESKIAKKTDGSKTKSIRGIHKLMDANFAGTAKSNECIVIFCEGDSAKAGIVSGLTKDDRNYIGVYPMKGKIFNTRGEALKRIMENKEIAEIKQILGLESSKKYTSEEVKKSLRYGKILFMTDQDLDGSHIKGLGLNLFQDQWNSLSKVPNFLGFMNTPILKAKKGSQQLLFYNQGEYDKWKETNDHTKWNIKYYKGLGTSTGKEFKEYFEHKKYVYFDHNGDSSDDIIDMVFNKKRADERKIWLTDYDRTRYLDTNNDKVSYQDFISKEFIHFSKYDCERSIPNIMDGLKISQRKIIYSAFKKNLKNEIKVAQFSGYVSEHSGYHHGEASLNAAIVNMAQNFVGSNNINLLQPNGQFGTRLQGGKDSASERYIFTQLNKLTRLIYREEDDAILTYLDDDGMMVEPMFYAPIIPMILVNGAKGIGTGFSTDILSYDVTKIIDYLKLKLDNSQSCKCIEFIPHYNGFQGTIEYTENGKYLTKGIYKKTQARKLRVTELPIGHWTDDFKGHLENLMDKTKTKKIVLKDYNDMSTDTRVDFELIFNCDVDDLMHKEKDGINEIEKMLKLHSSLSSNNMHLFDHEEKLRKHSGVSHVIDAYYEVRYHYYGLRKANMIKKLQQELKLLSNKASYITENINGTIDLRRKKKDEIIALLESKKYDKLENDEEYKYLVKMTMDSVSHENVEKLMKDKDIKEVKLQDVEGTTLEQMWLRDLEELEQQLLKN